MALRFRAHLRFTQASGMAQWGADQMAVRLAMAFHMNEGARDEERSHVTVRDDGTLDMDVFWPDDRTDLVTDTQATFATLGPRMHPDTDDDRSWMDSHECRHDIGEPCPAPSWTWSL